MKKTILFYIINIISVALMIFIGYVFIDIPFIATECKIKRVEVTEYMCVDTIKKKIDALVGREFELVVCSMSDKKGFTYLSPLDKKIFISRDVDLMQFCWAYAHETQHKVKLVGAERRTQLSTFKMLYESGEEFFKQVALNIASKMNGGSNEYNCLHQIQKYLERKGELK